MTNDVIWPDAGYVAAITVLTCVYLSLNLKGLSIKGFAVRRLKRKVSSVASTDTERCDRFLNGDRFMSGYVDVIAGAFKSHNKIPWISILVHHSVLQPE